MWDSEKRNILILAVLMIALFVFTFISVYRRENPPFRVFLINYAQNCCAQSSAKNCETGIKVGGFHRCTTFSLRDLDADFRINNSHILSQTRGAGYWLWKPYIIYHTLKHLNQGDIMMYSDAGSYFVESAAPLIEMARSDHRGVVLFTMEHIQKNWTKRDAFILLDCDFPPCWNSFQHTAAFSLWKRTEFSLAFAERWLNYSTDARIITDQPNELGLPNLPEFHENRHDQSVLSLLAFKETVASYRDPSQYEGYGHHAYSPYSKIIMHTRWRE